MMSRNARIPGLPSPAEPGSAESGRWLACDRLDFARLYERLRGNIVCLTYPPGTALYENAIVQFSGLSRTPVRDVLKRLRDEGLVEIRAGAGSFVAKIDVRRLREAVTIRRLLEAEAASSAARDARAPALAAELRRIVRAQREALAARSTGRLYTLDEEFHEAIFRFAGLPMSWRMVRIARAEMDRIHHFAAADPSRPRRAIAFHVAIAQQIGRADSAGASAVMSRHMASNLDYLLDLALAHPDYLTETGR